MAIDFSLVGAFLTMSGLSVVPIVNQAGGRGVLATRPPDPVTRFAWQRRGAHLHDEYDIYS